MVVSAAQRDNIATPAPTAGQGVYPSDDAVELAARTPDQQSGLYAECDRNPRDQRDRNCGAAVGSDELCDAEPVQPFLDAPPCHQSSCSADASVSAKSVSELSRLYAKAAGRLSISASASSMRRWWSASAGASSRVAI